MALQAAPLMPEVTYPIERLGITLRLWAGCVWAAKPLDRHYLTADDRAAVFSAVDQLASEDPVFEAGVEAAPLLNALPTRNQHPPALDGVPDTSPVWRHLPSPRP
jgi:hypothetical protein